MSSETKFYILLGLYVGAWGLLPALTPKLVPIDLSWLGLGVLAFSFGVFMHAITFPCTDVVAEVWGGERARLLVYIGFTVYAVAMFFLMIASALPPAPGWDKNPAYISVFSQAGRMVVGSMISTIVAQLLDIFVFEKIKQITGERGLWLRNNLSTYLSQLVDTILFYSISFYGVIPNEVLPLLIAGTYLVKVAITISLTPLVYLLVYWVTGKWTTKVVD